jgi:hypothetical protein
MERIQISLRNTKENRELISDAMDLTGAKTMTKTVVKALKRLVKSEKAKGAK